MANYYHNKEVLDSLHPGDMIKFRRGPYSHWGIYHGGEMVVHLTGDRGNKRAGATVQMDDFWTVTKDKKAYKSNYKDEYMTPGSVYDILERAGRFLNRRFEYNVITFNCEHFATWCRYGIEESERSRLAVFHVSHVAAYTASSAAIGGVFGGPVGLVVGGIAGAVGATVGGVINGLRTHFKSQ